LSKSFYVAPKPTGRFRQAQPDRVFRDALKSEDIESIDVLKEKKAIEPYGEKGKNGVVLITTKKHKAKKSKAGQ
jgi:TonB-dependent SusC/RagA subfamily outer membrane receptor